MDTESRKRVLITVCDMLKDRGYTISSDKMIEEASEFLSNDSESFYSIVTNSVASIHLPSKIAVVWEPQFVVKTLRYCEKYLYENSVVSAIFISDEPLNIYAKKALKEISNKNNPKHKKISLFFSSELHINITKHPWVPQHIGLTPEEENNLMTKYRLSKKQFPRIMSTDPVAKYYGFIRGQIIKIVRLHYNAKSGVLLYKELSYRVVV